MTRPRLPEETPAPGGSTAAFITSAARCKRKVSPGCAPVPSGESPSTPVKTIKLLHAFGWLPSSEDGGGADRASTSTEEGSEVSASDGAPSPHDDAASAPCDRLDAGASACIVQSPSWPHDAAAAASADAVAALAWEFDPYLFIKRLPALHECVRQPRTEFLLPRRSRRCAALKTLVLDLDETLVHSTLDGACSPPDFVFSVDVGGTRHEVAVRRRPHLATFLERVSRLYEVVVFTASQAVYAEQLLDLVDPARSLIRHRIFREACVQWEGNYLKDLTILGRDLAHTLIVDNSPQAFGFQLENGVPIESWYDDDDDDELLKLLPFLEAAAAAPDVRPLVREKFRLSELIAALPDPLAAMC